VESNKPKKERKYVSYKIKIDACFEQSKRERDLHPSFFYYSSSSSIGISLPLKR
jgi:hypothetical protein